jgi:D-hexose-6-phosphate mutarotase
VAKSFWQVRVDGLQGTTYMDSLQDKKQLPQKEASVRFAGEVDRIYLSTPDTLEVFSAALSCTAPLCWHGRQHDRQPCNGRLWTRASSVLL